MKAALGRAVGAFLRSRPWRANARLGQARGNVLAAGIAFYGFFSLFPLLGLGFALLGWVARGDEQLQGNVVAYLQNAVPVDGVFVESPSGQDPLVDPDALVRTVTSEPVLGWAGLLAVGVLLFTASGWLSALRGGIRSVFLLPPLPVDIVRAKLMDLAVAPTLGLLVVASALVSVTANTLTEQLLELLGLGDSGVGSVAARLVVVVAVGVLDTVLFMLLYRVLARAGLPWRQLASGAVVAAVLVGLLKLFGGVLLGGAADRPVLAAFAVPVALLVWLNLTGRATLFGASWAAVGVAPEGVPSDARPGAAEGSQGAVAGEAAPAADARPSGARPVGARPVVVQRRTPTPALPERWTDRVVLGAGIVLGATGAVLLSGAGAAARAATEGLRSATRD